MNNTERIMFKAIAREAKLDMIAHLLGRDKKKIKLSHIREDNKQTDRAMIRRFAHVI